MKSTFVRFVCRILALSIIVLPLQAQAGLIGTDKAVGTVQSPAALIDRGAVAAQLQSLGISPDEAKARVDALTDAQITSLAGRIDALPAGGIAGLLPIIVVIFLIYQMVQQTDKAVGKGTPKPAPTPAPTPEKK